VQLAWFALAAWLVGMFLIILINAAGKGEFSLSRGGPLGRFALICVLISVVSLAAVFIGLLVVAVWWLWNRYAGDLGPGNLALFSLLFGPAPLLISAFASVVARLIGGTVDASQARHCIVLGVDLGGIIYTLFMAYMLVYVTAGLALPGLLASGIWALVKLLQ